MVLLMKTVFTNLMPSMNGMEWFNVSPYPKAAPRFERVSSGEGVLVQHTNGKRNCFGRWIAPVAGVAGGKTYQFSVKCRAYDLRNNKSNLHVMLTWRGADMQDIQRDYVPGCETGDGIIFERVLPAPEGSVSVLAELCFKWSDTGRAEWSCGQLFETSEVAERHCRIASAFTALPGGKEQNLHAILKLIDKAAEAKPDILCLGETVLSVGTPFFEAAVTVDGPEVEAICKKAREYNMYIVVGLNLLEDEVYYNVAMLVDRAGKVAGIYRKLQIPLAEAESGYAPGYDSPVFETDFGKIGFLICWDHGFPEAVRLLCEKGAEILFVPSMWNAPIQAKARGADNGVFVVVSAPWHSGDPCFVVDPFGEIIASCKGGEENPSGYCVADVELEKQYKSIWFSVGPCYGEHRTVLAVERRGDLFD